MRAWIVTVGKPLPIDAAGNRLHRGGMIADAATKRGHEVPWWPSTLCGRMVDHLERLSIAKKADAILDSAEVSGDEEKRFKFHIRRASVVAPEARKT